MPETKWDVKSKNKMLPFLAACAGNIFWGLSYLFTRLALQVTSPEVLLSIRFLCAFLIMNLLILMGKGKVTLRGKKVSSVLLLAITEPLYFYFGSYGILYTNATFAGVALAVSPVVSILVAAIFLKEYPSKRQAVFCFLPVAGVILMTLDGSSLGIIQPVGSVFLLCTCLLSAVYKTVNRKSVEEFSAFERTYMVLLFSSVAFTISVFRSLDWNLAAYLEPLSHAQFTVPMLTLCLFCSVGANLLVNYAAGRMSVAKLSTFGAVSTLCSMLAGVIFLQESMTLLIFLGSVLILVGIRQVTK